MADGAGARDLFWQDCVGADHPGILLRKGNLEHLRMTYNEIGFKYIRFHGIFADDMEAYREVDGRPTYNFDKIDAVYDAIRQNRDEAFGRNLSHAARSGRAAGIDFYLEAPASCRRAII